MTADYEVDLSPVTLYLPAEWPASLGHIVKGSALVGSAADDEAGCVVVDYAGAVFPRSPAATLADHAHNAWGRHVKTRLNPRRAATIARVTVHADRLRRVGTYDPREGEVTLDDDAATMLIAEWIDIAPSSTGPLTDTVRDAVAAQCLTVGQHRHDCRRRVRALLAEKPHMKDLLRPHARSMGIEDLLDGPARHTTPPRRRTIHMTTTHTAIPARPRSSA